MKNFILAVLGFFLIQSDYATAYPKITEQDARSTLIVDRMDSESEANSACDAFAKKFNSNYICALGGAGYNDNYGGGYSIGFWEPVPNGESHHYLASFLFCSDGSKYSDEFQKCMPIQPFDAPDDFGKSAGPQCPACGQPINPGNGNMWHVEKDYINSASRSFDITRTYNSSLYSGDAAAVHTFGKRWTHIYDSVIKIERKLFSSQHKPQCWQITSSYSKWCEYPSPVPDTYYPNIVYSKPEAVSVLRADGKKFMFSRDGKDYVSDKDVSDRLVPTYSNNGVISGWVYTIQKSGDVENYDAEGKMLTISRRNGLTQRLTYSNGKTNDSQSGRYPVGGPICTHSQQGEILPAGKLLCVSDQWGHQLNFEYDAQGRVTKIIDPEQQETLYSYDGASGGCKNASNENRACSAGNLTQVTYPGGLIRTYSYNESSQINGGASCPGASDVGDGFAHLTNSLTSITDENGTRHILWTYDCDGRATSSELAGGVEKVALSYSDPNNAGESVTTVTHYLGTSASPQITTRKYNYKLVLGMARNTGIDKPCVECGDTAARTYDASGNTETRVDWKGNKTVYGYDISRNLEKTRTEKIDSDKPEVRVTTTEWHTTFSLPVKIFEPKRITSFTYDTAGNMLTKTQQATTDLLGTQGLKAIGVGPVRKWTYTYNSVGQMLTSTGPRTDIVDISTYTYDTVGNLARVENALGQITTFGDYDASGRPGSITEGGSDDANKIFTSLTYSPRGWLKSRTVKANGLSETTQYDYDGVGQLTQVTMPDASTITYSYDGAHRLTKISDSYGNSITYTLDNMGNRVKEEVKDAGGALKRQTTRVIDALNRVQQITGAQ